jgi:hypothetical protein
LARLPRAVDELRVILRKRLLNDEDRQMMAQIEAAGSSPE